MTICYWIDSLQTASWKEHLRSINLKKLELNICVLEEDVWRPSYHHPAIRHHHGEWNYYCCFLGQLNDCRGVDPWRHDCFLLLQMAEAKNGIGHVRHAITPKMGVRILQRKGSLSNMSFINREYLWTDWTDKTYKSSRDGMDSFGWKRTVLWKMREFCQKRKGVTSQHLPKLLIKTRIKFLPFLCKKQEHL